MFFSEPFPDAEGSLHTVGSREFVCDASVVTIAIGCCLRNVGAAIVADIENDGLVVDLGSRSNTVSSATVLGLDFFVADYFGGSSGAQVETPAPTIRKPMSVIYALSIAPDAGSYFVTLELPKSAAYR